MLRQDLLIPDSRELLRSEEHTSELQSQSNLVCRPLLEYKKVFRTYCLRSKQYLSAQRCAPHLGSLDQVCSTMLHHTSTQSRVTSSRLHNSIRSLNHLEI